MIIKTGEGQITNVFKSEGELSDEQKEALLKLKKKQAEEVAVDEKKTGEQN